MHYESELLDGLKQNRTTAGFIFERIKRDIITGAIKPGERLIERELTERFEVSRTPVREAFRRLERSQLVINIPYRGVEVRRISFEFARDAYDLRLGTEGIASYLAAERATHAELVKLEHIFNTIERLTAEGNRDDVMILNNEFHMAIAEATHNQLLVRQVEDLWITINSVRGSAWKGTARTGGSLEEHQRILSGIMARDPELARAATEAHVRQSWKVVEEALLEDADARTSGEAEDGVDAEDAADAGVKASADDAAHAQNKTKTKAGAHGASPTAATGAPKAKKRLAPKKRKA